MEQLAFDDVVKDYREVLEGIPREMIELDMRVTFLTIQAFAEDQPLSAEQLAEMWQMPIEQVQTILKQGAEKGSAELDSSGNLIGAVLTTVPTHHRIQVNGQTMYAWCSYDAIYIPGILGKRAEIESTDPISHERIRLTVAPDGIVDYHPSGTVVSIVTGEAASSTGPNSPRCSQMLFFASRESAAIWAEDRLGIAILTVEEVYQLARRFQIKPAKQLRLLD
jgi:alkylmercury lyase